MLIPYSTDAPLYHYPISTVSLIVINVLVYAAFCVGLEPAPALEAETFAMRLTLQFGHGFLPWQWLTSMFMHMGLMHLIGNMIFLWSFGLVLEGKMGHVFFVSVYLAMGVAQAFIVQTLMFFSEGSALGASGAIFSLLGLVVVFAPVNSFEVILLLGRVFTFEMPILIFGFFYFAMNSVFFFVGGAHMSSEALHLIGGAVGLPVGFYLLTRGHVDCEGYDVISYFQGNEGRSSKVGRVAKQRKKRSRKQADTEAAPSREELAKLIQSQIDQALQEQKFDAAAALHRKLTTLQPDCGWQREQLIAMIRGYLEAKHFGKAEALMTEYIAAFEEQRFAMQNKLLKIWLHQQRPKRVLRYIQDLNASYLTEKEQLSLQPLAEHATKMIRAGVLEVE